MGVVFLAFELIAILALTATVLSKYCNWRKHHPVVTLATLVGWYFSFLIILVLPLDVAITFYRMCQRDNRHLNVTDDFSDSAITNGTLLECEEPRGYVPEQILLSLWRVVYWTSQLLTWLLLPIMQIYSRAGEFTATGKLKYALYNNMIYYASYGIIFIFLLFYAVSKGVSLNFDHLKVLIVSASNTWGLFILVVLLGYGLVEVPRHFWEMGRRGYRLNQTYFEIDKLSSDKNEAEDGIAEVYREAREVMNVLKSTRGDAREKAHQIMARFPQEVIKELNSSKSVNFQSASTFGTIDVGAASNDSYLVRLHKRVINAVQYHHRTQTQWHALIEKALYLEDVEQAETSGKVGRWSVPIESQCCLPLPVRPPENVLYAWHVKFKRPFFKACGVAFAVMTLLILWSECTFFIVHPQLSLAARILHGFAENYHYKYVQVAAIALISYMGMCAYYTVFKLRIYRYYQLDRCSDENSLIFSAMLLCRLTPPMCLNFLGMIHLDSHITSRSALGVETQFTQLMGHLDVIPILAKGINIYLPILIVLLCLGTWFQLGTRFLHSLGIDQFIDDDDMTAEMVQGGRALVALERNRINRIRSKEERNQAFSSRLQGPRQQESQPLAGPSIPADDSHLREYSDREPIIDHQDNAGLLADYDGQPQSHVGEAAPFPDLEFGGFTFDTTSSLPTRTDARNHPPPSNIFDDL